MIEHIIILILTSIIYFNGQIKINFPTNNLPINNIRSHIIRINNNRRNRQQNNRNERRNVRNNF